MDIDLDPIVDEIAARADDFLAGATNRDQARAGISELIALDYADLTSAQRNEVAAGVMRVLEDEDFFGTEYVGDPFKEDAEAEDE